MIWDRFEIKDLPLNNRLVRSATWEGLADESGGVTDELVAMLAALAQGGVGLIITGFSYISPEGKVLTRQTGIYADALIPGLTRLTLAVHQAGGRIATQIVHGGLQANPRSAGSDVPPTGPSVIELPGGRKVEREFTSGEIQGVVDDFARAAARAQAAGFDAVQLHGAHAYLLSQFLSPFFNRRGDRYGGSLANRARIVYETYEAVRSAVGSDYPILIKINGQDCVEGGLELADSVAVARNLAEMGLDAFEVSGGTPWSGALNPSRPGITSPEQEAYFRPQARVFKEKVPAPIILVGGLRSLEVIEEILAQRDADMVAMCRPLIREPNLPARWAAGDLTPAACISCRGCFKPGLDGRGVSCVQLKD